MPRFRNPAPSNYNSRSKREWKAFEPSPEEIARRAAEVRAKWSEAERESRRVGSTFSADTLLDTDDDWEYGGL